MGCCHEKRSKFDCGRENEKALTKEFRMQTYSIRERLSVEEFAIMDQSNYMKDNDLSISINAFDEELNNNNSYMITYCGTQIKEKSNKNLDGKGQNVMEYQQNKEIKCKMQESFFSFTNNNETTVDNFEISFKIVKLELVLKDFKHIFRVKPNPILKICFEDFLEEFYYTRMTLENNPKKTFFYYNSNNTFSMNTKAIYNTFSVMIFEISQKNEVNENLNERINFSLGEGAMPFNILKTYITNIEANEDKNLQISIINTIENVIIGYLTFEFHTTYLNNYSKSPKNTGINNKNHEQISNLKNKFREFQKIQLVNYFDIDHKLRDKYFKDFEILSQINNSFEIEANFNLKSNEDEKRDFNKENLIYDQIKKLIYSSKFDELRNYILIDNQSMKYDYIKFYLLLYILNEIIENNNLSKIHSDIFYQVFLYQILETKFENLKNVVLIDCILRFLIKVKEKNLIKKDFKFHLINLEKVFSFIKSNFYPHIVSSLKVFYERERFLSSDLEFYHIKSIFYNLLYLIKLIFRDEMEFEKKDVNETSVNNSKSNKNSSKMNENILKIIEKDIIFFRKIYKEFFLIQEQSLLNDYNIVNGITKCFIQYIKLTKKFCMIRNVSKTIFIQQVFLNENPEFLLWMNKMNIKFLNNKKLYVEFLDISNELLQEACGIFLLYYINVFSVKMIVSSFYLYKNNLTSENFKIWLYFLSILSKISCQIKSDKFQNLDNLSLSNGETCILLFEVLDIFFIFESNKSFIIEAELQGKTDINLFLSSQVSIQIQIKAFEILKNLTKNRQIMIALITDEKSIKNNREKIIRMFGRLESILFLNKNVVVQAEFEAVYNNFLVLIINILFNLVKECSLKKDLVKLKEDNFFGFAKFFTRLKSESEYLKSVIKDSKLVKKLSDIIQQL